LSGYLQRLALGARNTGAIRPLQGSIFAGPQYGSVSEPVEVQDEVVVERQKESVPTPQRDPEALRDITEPLQPLLPPTRPQTLLRTAEAPRPLSVEQPVFKPLMPSARETAEEPWPEPASAPLFEPAPALHKRESVSHSEPEQSPAAKSVFSSPQEPRREQPGASPLMTVRRAGKGFAAIPVRSDKPAPQADEIQINIGRIEITAAPPAPVRAAPKPAYKSPDLGAYLKRRDGSAR
jgi:hypothetical protein